MDWDTLLQKLAEPFPADSIYWRAGSVSRDKKRAQALPYAEPRVYEDRLNALLPGGWSVSFQPWGENRIICNLTIHEITRASTGEAGDGFAPGTAAEAQAFKRACSKFGLGRYLYDVPIAWVDYDEAKRRLLEVPELPERFLPKGPVAASRAVETGDETQHKHAAPTLSPERARAMYRELEKLGLVKHDQHALAAEVLGHEVGHFSRLTEAEALTVWQVAKRENGRAPSLVH